MHTQEVKIHTLLVAVCVSSRMQPVLLRPGLSVQQLCPTSDRKILFNLITSAPEGIWQNEKEALASLFKNGSLKFNSKTVPEPTPGQCITERKMKIHLSIHLLISISPGPCS